MVNPFTLKVIPPDHAFCNRAREMKDLVSYAKSKANVVLFSPRRYGKTSLVKKVQAEVERQGCLTLYVDFFGLASTDDIADRVAGSVYGVLHPRKSLWQKALDVFKTLRPVIRQTEDGGVVISVEPVSSGISGIELLDKTMEELGEFIRQTSSGLHIVFDEFQEITELKDHRIEGVLRRHIQEQQASYFFVGSRRRVLLEMFTERSRPFFQSALLYKLKCLPHDELSGFIASRFKQAEKKCPLKVAEKISMKVSQHPYYAQKLAFHVFEISKTTVNEKDVEKAFYPLLEGEKAVFEAILQGIAPGRIALVRALAKEPSSSILSAGYMKRHDLKSVGGVQSALKKLSELDLIEKDAGGVWRVVDPIFREYLLGACSNSPSQGAFRK